MSRRFLSTCFILTILAGLVWFSSHLAALRIFQVDECQNLYMARMFATGHGHEYFTNASLFLLGPLSWICGSAVRSVDAFEMARLIFLGVFWLNLFLIALIAGGRLYSIPTLVALVAAGTLAPLWDYGFEVRHDNLVLTGVLLIWWLVRVKQWGPISYLLTGAIASTMLFIAVKSLAYVLPLSLALLVFPPPRCNSSRWRLGLAWVMGAAIATVLIRIAYGTSGGWEIYLSVFHGVTRYSTGGGGGGSGFPAWSTLGRLVTQTPLLLAAVIAAGIALAASFFRLGKRSLSWEGTLPEFALLLGALAALEVNPTPYPYNLIHVVPYAFLFSFRYLANIKEEIWATPNLLPLFACILVFGHLVPFGLVTQRHLGRLNWRQEKLMNLAEDLTDPTKDRVYDGIGMVPTRLTIHRNWYLHGLNMQNFSDGSGSSVPDMLSARPSAVFIPSYRTDWLSDEDHEFIKQRYVPVSDDFWVLGRVLPAGGGVFQIHYAGRYRISTLKGSDLQDTYELGLKGAVAREDPGTITATLDGMPLCDRPVQLAPGMHNLECATNCQPAVVWVGPRLDRIHRIGPGDHRALFVNWY
jgi:hypothetical protein